LGFPDAYALGNVQALVSGSTARITFDPTGDAKDYRIYALPKKGDITADAVKGAVYRCGGQYALPFPAKEDSDKPQSPGIRTLISSPVYNYIRKCEEATLGYVYTTPADGRIPVYVLGDFKGGSDITV